VRVDQAGDPKAKIPRGGGVGTIKMGSVLRMTSVNREPEVLTFPIQSFPRVGINLG